MTVGPEKGVTKRERESSVERWPPRAGLEAALVTASKDTTVKRRDGEARDKSRDGNACHIDEATPGEVGNGVSSASRLPVS